MKFTWHLLKWRLAMAQSPQEIKIQKAKWNISGFLAIIKSYFLTVTVSFFLYLSEQMMKTLKTRTPNN